MLAAIPTCHTTSLHQVKESWKGRGEGGEGDRRGETEGEGERETERESVTLADVLQQTACYRSQRGSVTLADVLQQTACYRSQRESVTLADVIQQTTCYRSQRGRECHSCRRHTTNSMLSVTEGECHSCRRHTTNSMLSITEGERVSLLWTPYSKQRVSGCIYLSHFFVCFNRKVRERERGGDGQREREIGEGGWDRGREEESLLWTPTACSVSVTASTCHTTLLQKE